MPRTGTMGMLVLMALVPRTARAQTTDSAAAAKDSLLRASIFLRPLASLLVPGTGQLLAHQDRGAVYLAAELIGLVRYLHLQSQSRGEARRYRALAFDVARRAFAPAPRDTVFEDYETMERFTASGRYNQ